MKRKRDSPSEAECRFGDDQCSSSQEEEEDDPLQHESDSDPSFFVEQDEVQFAPETESITHVPAPAEEAAAAPATAEKDPASDAEEAAAPAEEVVAPGTDISHVGRIPTRARG